MSEYTFRLCEQKDAAWMTKALENPQIGLKEVRAGSQEYSPSVFYVMVERKGIPVVFAPIVTQWTFAHLGFSEESSADERKIALEKLVVGVVEKAFNANVRMLTALTLPEFPVARFAVDQLGFEWEPRKLIYFDINKLLPKQS